MTTELANNDIVVDHSWDDYVEDYSHVPSYEPTYDAAYGVWIHDPFEIRDHHHHFHNFAIPPQCAWRDAVTRVTALYSDIVAGEYILVGDEWFSSIRGCDEEVAWALRMEPDETWSYHAIFAVDGTYGYISYAKSPVDTEGFAAISPMGPIAPIDWNIIYEYNDNLGFDIHDPYHVMDLTRDGYRTFPGAIPVASAAFWSHALKEISWSMAVYDNPQDAETVLIRQEEQVFRHHATPFTVRYMARYHADLLPGARWKPIMTIQPCGEEFIGYTYEWREVNPMIPPPALDL